MAEKFIKIHRPDLPEVGEGLVSETSFRIVYQPKGWVEVGTKPAKKKNVKPAPESETTTDSTSPDTMTDET